MTDSVKFRISRSSKTVFSHVKAQYGWHNVTRLRHSLNGPFPRHPGKPAFWILLELRMTEVAVTTGVTRRAKLQPNRHHQKPTPSPSSSDSACPFCRPANSGNALMGKISHSNGLARPSSPRVFQPCCWPLKAPGYFGGELPRLWSALWRQYSALVI